MFFLELYVSCGFGLKLCGAESFSNAKGLKQASLTLL